jgi:chromosome partitioning protein
LHNNIIIANYALRAKDAMIALSIANQKGGTGKTTTARELGTVLAATGVQVLLIDLDPQASLTASCGVKDVAGRSLAEVLGGASPGHLRMEEVIIALGDGLFIVPAHITLASCELGLTARMGRESVLKRALKPLVGRFDVAILDCPPSLGLLTVAGLVASDGVLIPTQPQIVDLRGLALFVDTVQQIQAELNPELELVGIVVSCYNPRLRHHQQAIEFINQAGLPIIGTVPRSVKLAEASGLAKSVTEYAPNNPTAEAYRVLGGEVLKWITH